MPRPRLQLRILALAPSAPATSAELLIYGDIGESWNARSVEAADIVRQLGELPPSIKTIVVRINSYGGSVSDGLAIYNSLRQQAASIEVRIDGIAASIASLIAMAGDRVLMPPAALLMVHAPWGASVGNAGDMREFADQLDQFARAMAEAYARKAGTTPDAMLALLTSSQDHWFTAAEAVSLGLADELLEDDAALHSEPEPGPAESAFAPAALLRAPARIAAALRRSPSPPRESIPMPTQTDSPVSAAARSEVLAAERDRRSRIRAASREFLDHAGVRDLTDRALDDTSMTAEQFGLQVLAAIGRHASPVNGGGTSADYGNTSGGADFVNGAADALLIRAGVRLNAPHAAARDFRHVPVVELARASLSRAGRPLRLGNDSPEAVVRAALSTSDFPLILENALGKAIRKGMEAPAVSHRTWCRVTEARDFKPQSRVLLGSAPALQAVPEMGEYTYGALSEDRASLTVGKFGRIVALSYEALVNDDLGAFLAIGPGMGLAALRAEADALYTLLTTNTLDGVVMQDSQELFDATHNNTVSVATGTGKPLTAAALSAARAKLRRQTGVGGSVLNLTPKFLLVPPDRESEAEILVANSTISTSQAGAEAAPGWLAGLTVVCEPRLASADTIYVVADNGLIDTGEVALLPGSPEIIPEDSFDVDARRWKVRHSFGVAILDHRGIVKLTLTT